MQVVCCVVNIDDLVLHCWHGKSYQQTCDDQALGLLCNGLKGVSKECKGHRLASFPGGKLLQFKLAMLARCCKCTQPNTLYLNIDRLLC